MFTGIIEELGRITAVADSGDGVRVTVRAPKAVSDAAHGDSIAVSGVCLTVIDRGDDWFTADVMRQTLDMSTLDGVAAGRPVNLERATPAHGRLGGHVVQGHIDGTGEVLEVRPGDAWRVLRVAVPAELAPLVADKGSIAVDGVSLTVSRVSDPSTGSGTAHSTSSGTAHSTSSGTAHSTGSGTAHSTGSGTAHSTPVAGHDEAWFEVSLIPETLAATTLGDRVAGDRVNLETDILARHVQRLLAFSTTPAPVEGSITAPTEGGS